MLVSFCDTSTALSRPLGTAHHPFIPIHIAADSILHDPIDRNFQEVAIDFAADLPMKAKGGGSDVGRLDRGCLPVHNVSALGSMETVECDGCLGEPALLPECRQANCSAVDRLGESQNRCG
jgi:hypothetical protein